MVIYHILISLYLFALLSSLHPSHYQVSLVQCPRQRLWMTPTV